MVILPSCDYTCSVLHVIVFAPQINYVRSTECFMTFFKNITCWCKSIINVKRTRWEPILISERWCLGHGHNIFNYLHVSQMLITCCCRNKLKIFPRTPLASTGHRASIIRWSTPSIARVLLAYSNQVNFSTAYHNTSMKRHRPNTTLVQCWTIDLNVGQALKQRKGKVEAQKIQKVDQLTCTMWY